MLGPLVAAVFGAYGAVKLGPPVVRRARQRAYDEACTAEAVRLASRRPRRPPPIPVRPRHSSARSIPTSGAASTPGGSAGRHSSCASCGAVTRSPGSSSPGARPRPKPGMPSPPATPASTSTGLGRRPAGGRDRRRAADRIEPLDAPHARGGDAGALHGLAAALAAERPDAEVRLRLVARPVPPDAWRREVAPEPRDRSIGIGRLIGHAIIEGLLFHAETTLPEPDVPRALTPDERAATQRRRAGLTGFDVGLVLEVAGAPGDVAEALLWRLVDFTGPLADPHQAIGWTIRRGAVATAAGATGRLGDRPAVVPARHELRRARGRSLATARAGVGCPDRRRSAGHRHRPEPRPAAGHPDRGLARHMAIFGATGSGKSTLLLNLVAGGTGGSARR